MIEHPRRTSRQIGRGPSLVEDVVDVPAHHVRGPLNSDSMECIRELGAAWQREALGDRRSA